MKTGLFMKTSRSLPNDERGRRIVPSTLLTEKFVPPRSGVRSVLTCASGGKPLRTSTRKESLMAAFLLWLVLLLLCWPLALAALVLYPIVWLILLPFRIVGIAVDGVLRLLAAIVTLPARILRGPRRARIASGEAVAGERGY